MTIQTTTDNGWRRFWNRGGFWRAILIVAAYYGAFNALQWIISTIGASSINSEDLFADPATIFWSTMAGVIAGGLLVLAFTATLGWIREIFGRQPIGGSWWMWIAPAAVLVFNALRYASVDYAAFTVGTVLTILALGLAIGFTEELICRGLVVNLMRRRGYGEWMVMLVSALTFALLHIGYLFTAGVLFGAIQLVYTFFFGVLMYLTLRVTGNIVWPMLVHASTDPSLLLGTGAIGDAGAQVGDPGPLASIAGLANPVVIVVGLVLLIFVRGRVTPREAVV